MSRRGGRGTRTSYSFAIRGPKRRAYVPSCPLSVLEVRDSFQAVLGGRKGHRGAGGSSTSTWP